MTGDLGWPKDYDDPVDPDAVIDGAELLDQVESALERFVALPTEHARVAVVLWVATTHAVSVFDHATRLAVHSAVKRSGKSRLLEVVEALSSNSLATTNISTPALFRVIESKGDRPPTLILDEADRLFGSAKKDEDNRDLIGLLNNGFRRGSPTWRCVGPLQIPTPFSNFAMAAIAGIGRKPDTIEDRAVNITIRRRLAKEEVEKFRLRRDLPAMHRLRDLLAIWAEQNLAAMSAAATDTVVPAELEDRAADSWEPLLAVANTAGGKWPQRARDAAVKLCGEAADADSDSLEIRLLADIRSVFDSMPRVGFLSSNVLLAELRKSDDAPWGDFDFTTRKLALRLRKFDVRPRHNSGRTERGYHREHLSDAFARYLRPDPSGPVPVPSDLGKRPDGSDTPDGLTRPDSTTRPDEPAGQTPQGRDRTGQDAPPASDGQPWYAKWER